MIETSTIYLMCNLLNYTFYDLTTRILSARLTQIIKCYITKYKKIKILYYKTRVKKVLLCCFHIQFVQTSVLKTTILFSLIFTRSKHNGKCSWLGYKNYHNTYSSYWSLSNTFTSMNVNVDYTKSSLLSHSATVILTDKW